MLPVEIVKCSFVSVRDIQPLGFGTGGRRSRGLLIDLSVDSLCQIRGDGLDGLIMSDWHNEDVAAPRYLCRVRIVSYGLGGRDLSFG